MVENFLYQSIYTTQHKLMPKHCFNCVYYIQSFSFKTINVCTSSDQIVNIFTLDCTRHILQNCTQICHLHLNWVFGFNIFRFEFIFSFPIYVYVIWIWLTYEFYSMSLPTCIVVQHCQFILDENDTWLLREHKISSEVVKGKQKHNSMQHFYFAWKTFNIM